MQPDNPNQSPNNPVRILVVEDVANVATVLKARLESYGYEICAVANTGQKAITGTMQHKPDIILMDIILEGDMNGIEAATEILKTIDVPIIYLSCLNDQEVMDRAIETNPYGYILKPYDNAELRFSIENALRKHRRDQERAARIADLESSRRHLDKGE
jgi:two-component system, response regulator PdtaR